MTLEVQVFGSTVVQSSGKLFRCDCRIGCDRRFGLVTQR